MNEELKGKVRKEIAKIVKNSKEYVSIDPDDNYYINETVLIDALTDALEKWCNKHQAFARHRGW